MTTREDANALVQRLHECFNTRRFDEAADLHTPDFFSHPLDAGIDAGMEAWRTLVARYPGMRVVAEDIVVERDKVAVRSTVEGIAASGGAAQLMEIFRIDDGRFAEMWGSSSGFPHSPEDLLGAVGG